MGYPLAERFPDFKNIFLETLDEADTILGFSLSSIIREGPFEKLTATKITQPALLTVSVAMSRWLESHGWKAEWALGHSVGEYSALVYAQSLTFVDALKLVHRRGDLMQKAVPLGAGGMAALLGVDRSTAHAFCKEINRLTNDVFEIALLNTPGQLVVSGTMKAIEKAIERAAEYNIRKIVPLKVSGPFHCSLLKKASEEFQKNLEKVSIQKPKIPVISNVTAKPETDPFEIKKNLVAQIYKPVLWEDSMRFVAQQSITCFYEVGSGCVLSTMLKKILPEAQGIAVETIQNLNDLG